MQLFRYFTFTKNNNFSYLIVRRFWIHNVSTSSLILKYSFGGSCFKNWLPEVGSRIKEVILNNPSVNEYNKPVLLYFDLGMTNTKVHLWVTVIANIRLDRL